MHASSSAVLSKSYKRRPWIAGLLSILVPGLGHLYNGETRKAALILLLFIAAWLLMLLLMLFLELAPANVALGIFLFFGTWIFIVTDAVRSARFRSVNVRHWYQRWYGLTAIFFVFGFVASALIEGVRGSFVEAFRSPTDSMAPTIQAGDYVLVRKDVPRSLRSRVVAFYSPAEPSQLLLKRVLAEAGDTIEMTNKELRVNGQSLREPYVQHIDSENDVFAPAMFWQTSALLSPSDSARYRPTRDTWGPLVVPNGHVFMLGDNRDDTEDSRYWGFVPTADIVGYPKRLYFSFRNRVQWDRVGRGLPTQ